jgi:hypothetical protein
MFGNVSLLAAVAELGPFFAVDAHAAIEPPWRPMSELVEVPEALLARVRAVRTALANGRPPEVVELRVAASVAQLGLVARLVAPVLGVAVLSGQVLDVELARIGWQPVLGGAFPLSLPRDDLGGMALKGSIDPRSSREVAEAIGGQVLDGPVRELVGAVRGIVTVSPRVLWGNVASAVNGAASMIATQRPDLGEAAYALAVALLEGSPLQGAGTAVAGPGFRRHSCCLIYRAAPGLAGAVCGDCVLRG